MTVATFDTLKFANTLKAAGVPAQQAEAQAVAFAEVIQVNFRDLVTKEDLDRATKATKADLDQLARSTKSDLDQLAKSTKTEIDQLAKSTKTEIDQLTKDLRSEIRDETAKLKLDIAQIRGELTLVKWMLGVVITLCTGIAVRLFFFR